MVLGGELRDLNLALVGEVVLGERSARGVLVGEEEEAGGSWLWEAIAKVRGREGVWHCFRGLWRSWLIWLLESDQIRSDRTRTVLSVVGFELAGKVCLSWRWERMMHVAGMG